MQQLCPFVPQSSEIRAQNNSKWFQYWSVWPPGPPSVTSGKAMALEPHKMKGTIRVFCVSDVTRISTCWQQRLLHMGTWDEMKQGRNVQFRERWKRVQRNRLLPAKKGKRSAAIDESTPVTPAGEAFQSLLWLWPGQDGINSVIQPL